MTGKEFSDFIEMFMIRKRPSFSILFDSISPGEYIILATVHKHEQENNQAHITVNKLASVLNVSVPSVSRSLKNLEKRGMINRVTDADCRRNTMVVMLEPGIEILEKSHEVLFNFASKVMDKFTDEDIKTIINYQKQLYSIFEEEIKPYVNDVLQQGGEF